MRAVLGWLLLTALAVAFFVAMALDVGVVMALATFALAGALCGLILLAVYLIYGGPR